MKTSVSFPVLLQGFFTDRLMKQQNASQHTIASYRDTFRLLLGFAQRSLKKSPGVIQIQDLEAPFIGRFLEHLEKTERVALEPATPVWPPSIPFSIMSLWKNRAPAPPFSGCWPFRENGMRPSRLIF